MKLCYEILYGRFRAPWDIGPRQELVELVAIGRLKPCTAIDLGSGTARRKKSLEEIKTYFTVERTNE